MQLTLLSVQGASKRFGDVVASRQVNLEIREGDIIGLVGPAAPGKTTLSGCYRAFTGLTSDNVVLDDGSEVGDAASSDPVVPENTGLYARLTAGKHSLRSDARGERR